MIGARRPRPATTWRSWPRNRIEHVVADIGVVHAARHAHVDLQHPLGRAGRLRRRAVRADRRVVENADHLARWTRRSTPQAACGSRRHRRGSRPPTESDSSPGATRRLRARRTAQPTRTRCRRARRRSDPRLARDDPLHLRHHRQPEGRGAHPPQRDVRGGRTLDAAGLGRDRSFSLLPAVRPHRRAHAGHVHPLDHAGRHPPDRRPGPAAGRARRGAPDPLLRRAPRLGEDQGRHLGQARRRAGPGTRGPTSRTAWPSACAWVESKQYGETTSSELQAEFEEADASMLSILRALLGLDRCEWAGSAAAPMPLEVATFFAGLGVRIYDIYGMTETCGAVTACGPDAFRLGTVGRATERHRGLVGRRRRDPVARTGHHERLLPAGGSTARADRRRRVGAHRRHRHIDDDGFLKVVDRKKEMIITSSGKNIAPSNIENSSRSRRSSATRWRWATASPTSSRC